jgi:flagellar biosynthesis anti-sigma factor FlgM
MGTDPNPGKTGAKSSYTNRAASATAKPSAKPTRQHAGERIRDHAEFSRLHSRAEVLTAQVNQLPDVRQERVAALANAVQNGTYQVSPEQTADAILSELHARSHLAA